MNKRIIAAAVCASVILAGCATKRYGRLQPLTVAERQAYDCRQLDIEIAKVEAFRQQVSDGAEVNLASVAGFLGDWGIGNSMERNAAEKSATQRMNDLLAARAMNRCGHQQISNDERDIIQQEVAQKLATEPSATEPVSDTQKMAPGIRCITCR